MPPRLSSVSRSGNGFYPASDAATYRDLLLFEERLKSNAAVLNRRKHRYQRGSRAVSVRRCLVSDLVIITTCVQSSSHSCS